MQFRNQVLREKLLAALDIEVADTKLMIHAAHILVASEIEANDITERLSDGEEFETLAAELSLDPSAYKGGDLGWFGPNQLELAFEDTAKATPIGEISSPVQTDYGWHLIKVYARTEVAMTAQEQESQRQDKFRELLEEWREDIIIEDFWAEYLPPQLRTPTATPMLLP
jgi:parvulin-like peptidyl-prolyl isomerase